LLAELKIENHVFRYVEKELYNYPLNKALIESWEQERREIASELHSTLGEDSAGRHSINRINNPTSAKALRLEAMAQKVDRARWYVKAIEDVLGAVDDIDKQLVEQKYFQGLLTNVGVARELNISIRDFYRRRKELIEKFALRMGLM